MFNFSGNIYLIVHYNVERGFRGVTSECEDLAGEAVVDWIESSEEYENEK